MKLLPLLTVAGLVLGLLVILPTAGSAQLQFGLTAGQNTNYSIGVMGGATAAGSDIPRHATALDNWVIYRGTVIPLPPYVQTLTVALPVPGRILVPPVILVSQAVPADQGLAPFSPAGTVATQGAY